ALSHLNALCPLSDWRSDSKLRLVNITQDVTPPEFVSAIITEVGMIPTTSIPVVLREYKNQV
ncbi:Eukaryotic translation initiation factor 2B, subunit 4 delta, 67kDa, partial [Coemansia sp. RSA 1933]